MAFPREHMLLQWTAEFRPGSSVTDRAFETVVWSLRFGGGAASALNGEQRCVDLANVLKAYWADPFASIPSTCFLKTVKWNRIGVDGHYADAGGTVLVDVPLTGGAAEARYPTQIAWATTWTTDKSRGHASTGRTYWPTRIAIAPSTCVVSADSCQSKANRDNQLIADLTAALAIGGATGAYPVVMSNLGAGAENRITGARVGNRLDIQRRRGNQMAESYAFGIPAV